MLTPIDFSIGNGFAGAPPCRKEARRQPVSDAEKILHLSANECRVKLRWGGQSFEFKFDIASTFHELKAEARKIAGLDESANFYTKAFCHGVLLQEQGNGADGSLQALGVQVHLPRPNQIC